MFTEDELAWILVSRRKLGSQESRSRWESIYRSIVHRFQDRVGCNDLRVRDCDGQTIKGTWGMSWRQKTMKGVEVCEKLGGVGKRAMIPRFPNDTC